MVADHGHVRSREDRLGRGFRHALAPADGAHIEIIGDYQPVEADLVAQELLDQHGGQRRRLAAGFRHIGQAHMGRHDGGQLGREREVRGGWTSEQCLQIARNARQILVGIDHRAAISWKMFGTAHHPAFGQLGEEHAGIGADARVVHPPTALAQRAIALVTAQRKIQHRGEVHVDAEQAEDLRDNPAVHANEPGIPGGGKPRGRGSVHPEPGQARNPAALLVDRDDRLFGAQAAQRVGEPPELPRVPDVAGKQDEPAGLEVLDNPLRRAIKLEPGKPQ